MFNSLAAKVPRDKDIPSRAWSLEVLRRVLNGTIYDTIPNAFHEERTSGGEYIPLKDRRPSVRYNLCQLVVRDSISLLFSDGHFPSIEMDSPASYSAMMTVIKDSKLPQVMTDAALRGSIGSIAVLMRVLRGRVFFNVMDTDYLTPEYDPESPDTLLRITEKYKATGRDLLALGYDIDNDRLDSIFWFQRIWDQSAELWFTPVLVNRVSQGGGFKARGAAENTAPSVDKKRTVFHNLGFVPLVWIKNLSGGSGFEGECTFRAAIDTQIEIEYQLSQAGRGLRYSSDPLLMLREPAAPAMGGPMARSASNALIVSKDGDAKLLEINGSAAAAVIEYTRALRESAIETIHGNRSSADKVSAAQSGRALEMMHQPLIWLADQLRTSYGENGILPLARMVVAASAKVGIQIRGETVRFTDSTEPTLRWPAWFPSTGGDRMQEASALATLRTAGLISQETAVKSISASFDVEDVHAELTRIKADEAVADTRAAVQVASISATETLPA